MCDQQMLRSACAYAQSGQNLCSSLEYSMSVKLLTEHLLEVLSLKRDCTCSSESTLVKMPHCWKSRVTAQLLLYTSPASDSEVTNYATESVTSFFQFWGWLTSMWQVVSLRGLPSAPSSPVSLLVLSHLNP